MSRSMNKRQQRQQRDLDTLSSLAPESDSEPDAPSNTFSALAISNPIEESESEEEEQVVKTAKSKKARKKKKKAKEIIKDDPISTPSAAVNKPSKKKSKQPPKDDIDRALEELSLQNTKKSGTSDQPTADHIAYPATQAYRGLLSVSVKHLDSEAELRRFFGSKVIASTKTAPKHRGVAHKSQLIPRPPGTWPMQRTGQGLTMRHLDSPEISRKGYTQPGEKWWTVEHSSHYKQLQLHFLQVVATGDHTGFMALMRTAPWHLDTLLQLGEIARHQEDNTQASDFVERAIFAFERSFSSTFNTILGIHRLDFDRIENRPFFMSLHRHIINLQRRGCVRSAFEFARLLLSLDPSLDPHGALLHLDYLAIKAGMYEWLIETWEIWPKVSIEAGLGPDDERVEVQSLPGWAWSRALALWWLEEKSGNEEHTASTEALQSAIVSFPFVLPVLADKANIQLSAKIRAHPAFRISTGWDSFAPAESTLHFLSHLYAHRASALWKIPAVAKWLETSAETKLFRRLESRQIDPLRKSALRHFAAGTPPNFVRHTIISEIRSLYTFLNPRAIPSTMLSYDPVPPTTSLSSYDEAYFNGVRHTTGAAQHREVDDDEMANRLMQEMIMAEIQRERGPPGAFPPAGGIDEEDGEVPEPEINVVVQDLSSEGEGSEAEGADSDQEDAGVARGFLESVYGLLWRRGPAAPPPDTPHAQ